MDVTMAGKSSSDKTEQPTQKRIRDARKKGQVAKGEDFSSAAVLLAAVLCLWSVNEMIIEDVERLLLLATALEYGGLHEILVRVGREGGALYLKVSLIVTGTAAVGALFVNFLQVGPIIAPEAVQPQFSKLNPVEKLKQIFSKDSAIKMLKSIVKILLLGLILVIAIQANIPALFSLLDCQLGCILPVAGGVVGDVMINALLVFVAVAVVDLFLSRRKYIKDLMMTKEEVKQEFKESEGDPHIKGKRKQFFSEIVNSQQANNVKRSSVVVTNPEHVAIGLLYDEEETPLPIVTFKAEGAMAARMIEIAKQEGVPIMQNVPLARSLLEQSRVEEYIPQDLIKPVAEVLRVVRNMR